MKFDKAQATRALKSKRALTGLTQKEIAKKIGIGEWTYCQKENNPELFKFLELLTLQEIFELENINQIFFS